MQDGSAPPSPVVIERACAGAPPVKKATTDGKGLYQWHMLENDIPTDMSNTGDSRFGQTQESNWTQGVRPSTVPCRLRARLAGYESNSINLADLSWTGNPELPTMTLYRAGTQEFLDLAAIAVPSSAETAWGKAGQAMRTKNWAEAEKNLRAAVQAAPKFAEGWNTLAMVCQTRKDVACERDAYRHAMAASPKQLEPRLRLMHMEMEQGQWNAAGEAATGLFQADTAHRHPEAYSDNAIVRFHLKDLDGAVTSATEAVRLDPNHAYPDSERVLGTLLEGKGDYTGAALHLRKYLELEPKAANAGAVRNQVDNLGRAPAGNLALDAADRTMPAGGEAVVPGGLKAFASVAHLGSVPTYGTFFELYCRAVEHETSIFNGLKLPKYAESIQAYTAAVAELARLGKKGETSTVVTVSLANAFQVLPLLGWKLVEQEGDTLIEPGDRAADALRQQIPAALGIDEIAMRDAVMGRRSYTFEIPQESARLLGGASWSALLKDLPPFPGGIAEAFARDFRMARAYAGLSAMGAEAAAAVVKSIGLRTLVIQYAGMLAEYGDAFAVSQGVVTVPGGAAAEPVWAELAGASPRDAPAFLRKVLEKDHGSLAAFYYALAHADGAHQRFFTQGAKRAEFFYAWYRDSGEIYLGQDRKVGTWHPSFFQHLPLDEAGHVHYPGGKAAWTHSAAPDDDALMEVKALDALAPVAQMEIARKSPLDAASAALLVEHYDEWSSLLPYFEGLPLGAAEFQALAEFGDKASALKPAVRNSVMAEWHSLVELTLLGVHSGAVDGTRAAKAFGLACRDLTGADHDVKALTILHSIAGTGNPDVAVPAGLLRLSGARLAAFERVKELQNVPHLEAAQAAAALSGNVYAALLDPGNLPVAADSELLRKHRFVKEAQGKRPPVFFATELVNASSAPGSFVTGGFAQMTDVMKDMAKLSPSAESTSVTAETTAAAPGVEVSGPAPAEAVFRTSARLVEVYATVTDDRGRYIDDLPARNFTILESGKPVPAVAFESRASSVSLALLFDTTGSMHAALPSLKNAALKLIGELRPIDSVAVYSFADTVNALQPFTNDKAAAERAVLRTHAAGATALYDALVRVNHDLASRSGKKVIVVFTDGSDNLSVLTTEIAMQRAKSAGVPIYTIAQGDALKSPVLLKQLSTLSKATGGVAFTIGGPGEIRKVFETVSQDLMHGYLLAFQPPPAEGHMWRTVEITLADAKNRKVRAREGYFPE